jgi:hypothetical protein
LVDLSFNLNFVRSILKKKRNLCSG